MIENTNFNARINTKHVVLKNLTEDTYTINEANRTLCTNIQFCGDDVNVIAVTSCIPNEGKSTVSLDLSRNLAELGKKVLLIDADLRKSVFVRKHAEKTGIMGLSQFLSGQAVLQDVLYSTQIPNFYVIFSGTFPPNPVELLGKTKFKDFIDNAKRTFDYIIIDCPPLGSVIDAAVVASVCDSAIMVISSGIISAKFAKNVKSQLEKSGCHILGVVLNNVDQDGGGYYYRKYKHYGKYKYGYYSHYYAEPEQPKKRK